MSLFGKFSFKKINYSLYNYYDILPYLGFYFCFDPTPVGVRTLQYHSK